MTAFMAWCGRRPMRTQAFAMLLLAITSVLPDRAALAADRVRGASASLTVVLDEATVLKLPERTTTLVVGNPLIADVSVQPGGVLVVTGKGYGVTNVLALDRAGTVMMERIVTVQGPSDNVVVVYRGIDRESYSCTPKCERRIMLGDTPAYFTATLTQAGNLNLQAQGQGQVTGQAAK
jgi:hypothetical protein